MPHSRVKPNKVYYENIKAKLKDKCSAGGEGCGGFWSYDNPYCDMLPFCELSLGVCYLHKDAFLKLGKELGFEDD